MAILSIESLSLEVVYRDFEDGWVYDDIWLRWRGEPVIDDRLGQALTALRLARHGTYAWTTTEAEGRLRGLDFEEVETFSPDPLTVIVVGKKVRSAE